MLRIISRTLLQNSITRNSYELKRRYIYLFINEDTQTNEYASLNYNRLFSTSVYLVDEEKENIKKKNSKNSYTYRNITCGDLRLDNVGSKVTLCGWLEFQRLSKFIILRDGYGQTQLILRENDEKLSNLISKVPFESIVKVSGTVLTRPKDMINSKLPTGEVEVLIDDFEILNKATYLPFNVRDFQRPKEAIRMKYRYLDLRFSDMQRNLRERSTLLFEMRKFLIESSFIEVETPTLFKATPGGAQEFIVPTKFPGQFYSLVQSPQQFKQILMAGGIDRYFQVARCYRDETSRPDRQPEFTQLDIEISFTTIDGVMELVEDLMQKCWPNFADTIPHRFPRLTYKYALEMYGSDKPDTSFDFKIQNCSSILQSTNLNIYKEKFGAYYIKFPKECAVLGKSVKGEFESLAKQFPLLKFIQSKISDSDNWITRMKNLFSSEIAWQLKEEIEIKDGDLLFLAYGDKSQVLALLGKIRLLHVNHLENNGLKIRRPGMHLTWIVDFPLFDQNDDGSLSSVHHPFTAPHPEDIHLIDEAPTKMRSLAYDLVLNGNEIAGGSIRVHDPSLQEKILSLLNIDVDSMKHIIEMLSSGCPPHGGIALGADRFLSILLKTASIRDVIAFPKGFEGRDPLSGAPSEVAEKDLKMYHIKCIE
ncbi:hypothetical protein WA026_001112 [Henosepilachna vigintioctopunctata]|uniref:Aminoacyl-transfer RNA synthetases class-II family profile domain-containing protein n=1 Tax=Henosepilachna vigintioctopunctata TaxID=420089 RepID=A0AAW1V7D1_9CUCU